METVTHLVLFAMDLQDKIVHNVEDIHCTMQQQKHVKDAVLDFILYKIVVILVILVV